MHLAKRSQPIREELQSLLTENNIECAIRKRHVGRVSLSPLYLRADLCGDLARHLQHALVYVGTNDRSAIIICGLEGGLILARARRDITPLDTVAEELASMIRSALPRSNSA